MNFYSKKNNKKYLFDFISFKFSYQPQPCPDTHMVCCKGYINIQAQCFSFNEIKDILPAWQSLFATFGSSMTTEQILNAVHQMG